MGCNDNDITYISHINLGYIFIIISNRMKCNILLFSFFIFYHVLRLEPIASYMLDKGLPLSSILT
jgi:hypothetical protein